MEGQLLLTTDAARALTTMINPNQSPPRPHRQAATRKVSHLLEEPFWHFPSEHVYLVPLGELGWVVGRGCICGENGLQGHIWQAGTLLARGINKVGEILLQSLAKIICYLCLGGAP